MTAKDISPVVFQDHQIRRIWFNKQWYFSVVDVIGVLTESVNPRDYWFQMTKREKENGVELSTFCRRLKLKATDGKMRFTDCADVQGLLRVIQSIPSKKAEPFKLWLAKVGKDRLDEIQNPELAMQRMKELYRQKGYPDDWIEKRSRGIAIRNELTDEWKNRGVSQSLEFAILTNEIMKGTFGMKVGDYKKFKKLKNENLRDHMDDMELIFTMLAEATTSRITRRRKSSGFPKLKIDAHDAGSATGQARHKIESKIGEKVSKSTNYLPSRLKPSI